MSQFVTRFNIVKPNWLTGFWINSDIFNIQIELFEITSQETES